jgi:hypothetical protein
VTPQEKAALVEEVCSAYRERRGRGDIAPAPAFYDLDDDGRREAFEATLTQRALEATVSSDGLSGTARAVLARIRGTR